MDSVTCRGIGLRCITCAHSLSLFVLKNKKESLNPNFLSSYTVGVGHATLRGILKTKTWMPTIGSVASNIAVCFATGLASRWFTPALPACPGCPTCPTCPTCPGCPGSPATPATPATPSAAEATENGWQWSTTCLVVTSVVSLLGPRRVVFWLNCLVARFETAPEQPEVRVATHPIRRRNGLRAIAEMGLGPFQLERPGAQLALASEAHIGGGGTYGWD